MKMGLPGWNSLTDWTKLISCLSANLLYDGGEYVFTNKNCAYFLCLTFDVQMQTVMQVVQNLGSTGCT